MSIEERRRSYVKTPLGLVELTESDLGITGARFTEEAAAGTEPPVGGIYLEAAKMELLEYFSGVRRRFTVPLDPRGTDFQKRVWRALADIPFGESKSYGEIAAALSMPGAARAVGAACGKNPLILFVPCHRVVGKNGRTGGYAAGVWRKEYLLDLEKNSAGGTQ